MDKSLMIAVGIGAIALVALGLVLFLSKCEPPQPPPSGYYYGLAEASGPDAEGRAIAEARARMVEMANVEVVVESVLEKNSAALCKDGKCDKASLERFKREIKTKAQMELSDYSVETKKCGDKVYALVYIPKARADLYFKALSTRALLDNAIEAGMIFTADRLLNELKSYQAFFTKTPSFLKDLSEVEAKLVGKLEKAKGLLDKIEGIKGESPEDVLRVLSIYRDMKSITPEIPKEVSEKVRKLVRDSGTRLEISGPSEVVKTELVRLKIDIPGLKGSFNFDVEVDGGKFPPKVTVENGRGILEGRVEGDVTVTVKLTDFLKSSWSPGSVLEPTLRNSIKVLMAGSEKPSTAVVFLPSSLDPSNVAAAVEAEKSANLLGWKFVSHKRLAEAFDRLVSNWLQDWKIEKIPAVFVSVRKDGIKLDGAVKGYISADVETRGANEEEIDAVLRAAVASGNGDLIVGVGGFLEGVALYSMGRLEDAKRVFEALDDPLSKLALSRICYDMGDYRCSIESASKAMEEYPNQALTLIALSLIHLPPESIFLHPEYQDYIFGAVHKVKDNHAGYYAAAVLLRKLGNCAEAEEWITKALDIEMSPDYLLEYARILKCLGKSDEAKKVLKEILSMGNLRFSIRKEAEEMLKELEK